MRAIILAAGKSTRLLPLTKDKPKCLIEIGNRTILDHQIKTLLENGVRDIIIVTGFQAQKIVAHLGQNYPDVDFIFIENKDYETTFPAHGLWLAKEFMDDEFLYLNADLFCHPEIIKSIIEHEKPHITAIQKIPWNEEAVNIIHDPNEAITEIGKHIDASSNCGEFIGITKFGKEFAEKLISALETFAKQGEKKKYAVDAINHAIKLGGKLHVLDVTHLPAIEIDSLDDYEEAKTLIDFL